MQAKSLEQAFVSSVDGTTQVPIDFISRDAYVDRLRRRYNNQVVVNALVPVQQVSSLISSMPLSVVQVGQQIYLVPASTNGQSITVYFDAIKWLPDFGTTQIFGTATSVGTSQVTDTTKNFPQVGVRIGDIIRNTTSGAYAVVIGVAKSSLSLSMDIFPTLGEGYQLDVIKEDQTNFLLTYCFDYMMFRTIYELNFFLKEDARVQLSDKLMETIWENVQKWNATIVGNTVSDNDLE